MKTSLITGVAGGIGTAAANLFISKGWDVVGVDKKAPRKYDKNYEFFKGDISNPEFAKYIFNELSKKHKRLDALINNAAIQICVPVIEMTVDDWDLIMTTNVRSVFLMVKNLYPLLRVSNGAIVNISSVHAIATSINIAAYAASKGALLALTRAMAIEFAPDNIRVNSVLPGAVDTSMLRNGLQRCHPQDRTPDELITELSKKHILGRIGKPEEIAKAIYFLADNDKSSFVTGQAFVVDGGATVRLSTE